MNLGKITLWDESVEKQLMVGFGVINLSCTKGGGWDDPQWFLSITLLKIN